MRVFLTGGTGAIGRELCRALLGRGDEVVVLSRDRAHAKHVLPAEVEVIEGDPCYEGDWQAHVGGCDAAISLAGESLTSQRWDARFRQVIHDSRIDSTRFLVEAITALPPDQRPNVLVATSAMDYYGFAEIEMFDQDEFDETATGGESFLSYLCWDWEEEANLCKEADVRVTNMRLGVVLGVGKTLAKFVAPFKKGFGGRIGNGRQWMSWVHIHDVIGAYLLALDTEIQGPINVVSPGNVRNAEFSRVLGNVLGRRSWFPARGFLVRASLGDLAEYVLKGRRLVPAALKSAEYSFQFSELETALKDLLSS